MLNRSRRAGVNSIAITSKINIIFQMAKREITAKYRGSNLGFSWAIMNPIFMLAVYTFVFSVIFKARWPEAENTKSGFAAILFVGLITHALFAEVLNKAPALVLANTNFVKKIVFPLETLSITATAVAFFNYIVSLVVLLGLLFYLRGGVPLTVVFLPLVIFPFLIMVLGLSWFLAALGVYFKDISQGIGIFIGIVAFLAPVFYPSTAIPASYRSIIYLNPITVPIEQSRNLLISGVYPDFGVLSLYAIVAIVVAFAGYFVFNALKEGFSDAL